MKLTSRNIILLIIGMAMMEIFAIVAFIIFLLGISQNIFERAGVQLNHKEIILYVEPSILRKDYQFLKAKLTYSRAKNIHQFLSEKPPSEYYQHFNTPKDIPLFELFKDKRWEPYKAKKYWIGSFDAKIDGGIYSYVYLFDITNTHIVYLYMHGSHPWY